MAEEAGSRGILVPLLLLLLAHSLGAPIWLLVIIGIWYSGLVYAESSGLLDRLDATRAMGVILMIRTRRGMRFLDFVSTPKRFWRGFGELSIWLCFFGMFMVVLLLFLSAIAVAVSPLQPKQPII